MTRTRRLTAVVWGTVGVLALGGAAPAVADGDEKRPRDRGWSAFEPAPDLPPTDVADCGTTLTLSAAVNQVVVRSKELRNGNTLIESKGALSVRVVKQDIGETIVVDASGASLGRHAQVAYTNGDFRYRARGNNFIVWNSPDQQPAGLPFVVVEHGPIDILFPAPIENSDGSLTFPTAQVDRIGAFRSVCTLFSDYFKRTLEPRG